MVTFSVKNQFFDELWKFDFGILYVLFLTENATIGRISKNDAERIGQKWFSSHGDPFREHFCAFVNFWTLPPPPIIITWSLTSKTSDVLGHANHVKKN